MSKKQIFEVDIIDHFFKLYPDSFFYSTEERIFYVYDNNGKWVPESKSKTKVDLLIKETINDLYGMISGINTHISNVKKLLSFEQEKYIKLILELDNHRSLLNCENSVVDLKTGEYLPHDKKYLFTLSTGTKIVKPEIDNNGYPVIPEIFDRFINNLVFRHNIELTKKRKYMLLKLLGSYLNGKPGKRSFLHISGLPGTGKSKLANILLYILGDYSTSLSFSTLATQKNLNGSSPSPELVEPMGKRFAITDEPSTSNKISSSFFKATTGGSILKARYLYSNLLRQEASTFTPIIFSNSQLLFDEVDQALLERMTIIETNRPVPLNYRDDYLDEKLSKISGEILGILVLLGCNPNERSKDFNLNPELDNLTLDLFDDDKRSFKTENSNPVELFFSEKIHFNTESEIRNPVLFKEYEDYCKNMEIINIYPYNRFFPHIRQQYKLQNRRIDNKHYTRGIELNKSTDKGGIKCIEK